MFKPETYTHVKDVNPGSSKENVTVSNQQELNLPEYSITVITLE